jgi:hypothetical protein
VGALEASLQSPASRERDDGRSAAPLSARATRLIAIAGLASFALIMVAALIVAPPLWNSPAPTSPAAQVAAYLQTYHGRLLASQFIYSLGMGLFLCFSAGLWSWLRRIEPAPETISAIFAFGAVALTLLIMASFAIADAMSYRPQQPAFAVALTDTTFGLLALSGIPTAVCLGAYAAIVLRHRCLPTWTAWLALLAVGAHLLIAASFLSHGGFLGLEGTVIVVVPATFFAWIFATSLVLLRTSLDVGADTHGAARPEPIA